MNNWEDRRKREFFSDLNARIQGVYVDPWINQRRAARDFFETCVNEPLRHMHERRQKGDE